MTETQLKNYLVSVLYPRGEEEVLCACVSACVHTLPSDFLTAVWF